MTSPSSISTRVEDFEPDWPYGPRAKRRKRASTADASRPSPREIGFMRESQNEGSASFIGSSSGIHFIRHVYNAFARRSADLQQTRAQDKSSVPGEDDRLQRGIGTSHDRDQLWSDGEVDFTPNAKFLFEDLIHWTRGYFENWHPIFPCLHAPTVLKAMEQLGNQGQAHVNHLDMIIIRSIISISLGDSRQAERSGSRIGPIPASLTFQSVQQVMQDIQGLLANPTTLPLLQAAFMIQLALTSLLRLNAASRVGGVITRTAFHLGLHRCPGRFQCFTQEEVDIRRRLFWSIYCLERYLSQALGIPLGIRDDDIDVCYPGDERHVTPKHMASDDHRLKLLCHLAKFARIRGLILELRNKSILHSHAGAVEASHVNGELSQWWNEVYDDVNPIEDERESESSEAPALSAYHRLLLMVLRHEAIISMNRPLLAADKPHADFKNALQTCIASSRFLLNTLKRYMSSNSDTPLTWPSFTWTTWMACLILMWASWEGEFPAPTALKYARMGIIVLENLALRGSSWPETCIEAIKSMESALSNNASIDHHNESSTGIHTPHKNVTNHTQTPGTQRMTRLSAQGRSRQSIGSSHGPANGHPDFSSSVDAQQVEPAMRMPYNGENYEAISSPPNISGNGFDISSNGALSFNGQSSGGLIFGSIMNNNAPFSTGMGGQDSLPFSDFTSLFTNDLWSVADGPWMIHGNFL
ncbi:hypothetical protein N7462_009033 [Penicillium macrosclerotiorum]|uniref:uncharacterized protein n=1 Tax=Penicillium macrosclerotiorum TaxID=303699 RepID=UPI002547A74A|nr:uncharacterized protein N7462_009033 [Penicillium macrosclerotiorum]KAJ5676136.1 hypothetical protein N7462_009033 [Penicillium macrosclerotiorum]